MYIPLDLYEKILKYSYSFNYRDKLAVITNVYTRAYIYNR